MTTAGADGASAGPDGWGVALGTSDTVLARHDAAAGAATVVAVPRYGRTDDGVATVPSAIHYADDGGRLVGREVLAADLLDAAGTVRELASSLGHRGGGTVPSGERRVSRTEACGDFLAALLGAVGPADAPVVLAAPGAVVEHDGGWWREVAGALPRLRLVDEPSAAAVGYGVPLRPGAVLMLVDCGAASVRAVVARVPDTGRHADGPEDPAAVGPCRVLGNAEDDVGGATIDGWLVAEVLARHGLGDDEVDRALARELREACTGAKHELTAAERARVAVTHPATGAVLDLDLVRSGAGAHDRGAAVSFEDLLDRHDLFARLDRVLRGALRGASERGYDVDDLAAVLLVGGTSLVPSVRRTVERVVGRARMYADHPRDAVACGAATVAAGAGSTGRVEHDYALRCYDRARGRYEFRTCVPAGTPYPSEEPVATVVLKASHDGQRELGIAVFELGEAGATERAELVLDPSGGWRLETLTPVDEQARTRSWVNERNPTYLVADPPARAGEARFRVELGIDADKRLVLTAHDLVSTDVVLRDHPVVDLR